MVSYVKANEVIKMTDKELFAKFENYCNDHGSKEF